MLTCYLAHQAHQQHVVVDGQVAFFVDRRQFKLVGGHFVVACLAWYAELQCLYLEVLHKFSHTVGYGTEVVVLHLLVFGRVVAHQCTACQEQVGSGSVEVFIHEEILLLPSQVGCHFADAGVEILAYCCGCLVHGCESLL